MVEGEAGVRWWVEDVKGWQSQIMEDPVEKMKNKKCSFESSEEGLTKGGGQVGFTSLSLSRFIFR